jgi:hypothetical protein
VFITVDFITELSSARECDFCINAHGFRTKLPLSLTRRTIGLETPKTTDVGGHLEADGFEAVVETGFYRRKAGCARTNYRNHFGWIVNFGVNCVDKWNDLVPCHCYRSDMKTVSEKSFLMNPTLSAVERFIGRWGWR